MSNHAFGAHSIHPTNLTHYFTTGKHCMYCCLPQPQLLHVLYEHACGYALFRVREFEEVGMLQPEVEESVLDLARFNTVVKLAAFAPFKSGANALDNMNSISEGGHSVVGEVFHGNTMSVNTNI